MARQNHGPLSRAKGKLGGVVYQQYEGMQISREYQPVVKNPQTTKQVENRAKFKLSSQIVAQFMSVISVRFAHLSIYERMRRAAAVNAIYGVIGTNTPASPEALVADVTAALNAKSMSTMQGPDLGAFDRGSVTITAADGDTCTYVCASYDSDGNVIKIEGETYKSSGAAKMVNIGMDTSSAVLMAVSFHALTEEGAATISNLHGSSTGWQNTIARGVANGDIEISNISAVGGTNA